jgi:quinol monooxygenase YgiN
VYGLITKMKTQPGQRDALVQVLVQGSKAMPGCIHYIIAKDVHDEHTVWVVETWDSAQAHKSSLSLPKVVEAMSQGKTLIAAIERRIETLPVSIDSCN